MGAHSRKWRDGPRSWIVLFIWEPTFPPVLYIFSKFMHFWPPDSQTKGRAAARSDSVWIRYYTPAVSAWRETFPGWRCRNFHSPGAVHSCRCDEDRFSNLTETESSKNLQQVLNTFMVAYKFSPFLPQNFANLLIWLLNWATHPVPDTDGRPCVCRLHIYTRTKAEENRL